MLVPSLGLKVKFIALAFADIAESGFGLAYSSFVDITGFRWDSCVNNN